MLKRRSSALPGESVSAEPPGYGSHWLAPSFRPSGLAGGPWEYPASAFFATALAIILIVDLRAPPSVDAIPFGLIVVVAAAWLLSTPTSLAVTTFAVALLFAEVLLSNANPVTAAVDVIVFTILALVTRFYATRLRALLVGSDSRHESVAATIFGLENLAHLVAASDDGVAAIDSAGRIQYANPMAFEMLNLSSQGNCARLSEQVVDADRSRVLSFVASAVGERAGHLTFRVRGHDGAMRQLEAHHTPFLTRAGRVSAFAIHDVTDVKRLQSAATALAETATDMAVTQPLEDTLAAVAARVVEISEACACAVFLLEGERSLRMAGSWGLPDGYEAAANRAALAGAPLPVFDAIETGAPVFVEDLPARINSEEEFEVMRTVARGVPWQLAVALPMIHAGQPVGGLAAYFPPGKRPDERTLDFLNTIASQAASAAQVSRLVSAMQGKVAGEERHRLSRELHDSLSQALYGIVLGAQSARKRLSGDAQRVDEPLDYILELAETALTDMRSLVLELRPESMEREGLVVALDHWVDALSERYGLEIVKQFPTEPEVPLETKLDAHRIVQETLNNVVKHAGATHAWLRVEVEDNSLLIEVTDDGKGFDPQARVPGHFGLESLRERVSSHGGEVDIDSAPNSGTVIRVRLFLPTDASVGNPEEAFKP